MNKNDKGLQSAPSSGLTYEDYELIGPHNHCAGCNPCAANTCPIRQKQIAQFVAIKNETKKEIK